MGQKGFLDSNNFISKCKIRNRWAKPRFARCSVINIYPLKIFECAVLVCHSKQEFTNTKSNRDAMVIHEIKCTQCFDSYKWHGMCTLSVQSLLICLEPEILYFYFFMYQNLWLIHTIWLKNTAKAVCHRVIIPWIV